jgi:hypothetical protein
VSCRLGPPLLSDVLRGIAVGHRGAAKVTVPVLLLEQAARALESYQRLAWCMDARYPQRPRELVRLGVRLRAQGSRPKARRRG